MPKRPLILLLALQLCSGCVLTDWLFSRPGRSGSSGSSSGSSNSSSGSSASSRPTTGSSGSSGTSSGSGSNVNQASSRPASSGTQVKGSVGASARPTVTLPFPRFEISPVPIGIPIPIPLPMPVGIGIPVPHAQPTPVPASGGSVPAPVVTAAPAGAAATETRLFEVTKVSVVRTRELNYRVLVIGKGFGVLESYQFLQARIGPFAVNLVEDGVYRANQAEVKDLAIGDTELSFVWIPAQGGPTASDKFQWSFQPRGVNQLFQTAELVIELSSE